MKRRNKKLLSGMVLPLIVAVVLVSAFVLVSYGFVEQEIEVKTPIEVSQESEDTITTWLGEETQVKGSPITIDNVVPLEDDFSKDIEVRISNDNEEEGISVVYLAKLELYSKNTETWEEVGDPKEILYTVIGEEFIVENDNEGLMVINYIEPSDPYTGAFRLPEDITTSFVDEKLWLVPEDSDLNDDNALDSWTPAEYKFEHELVSYTKGDTGVIIIPEGSSITIIPLYIVEVEEAIEDLTITTTVNNIE